MSAPALFEARPLGPVQPLRLPRAHWSEGLDTGSGRSTAAAFLAALAFVAGFGAWASLMPLSGAVVSSGYLAAAGRNLRIQHSEGGIVEAILVREGERVSAGQVLFRLDATAAAAQRNRLRNQGLALQARAARLVAERGGAPSLVFPPDLEAGRGEPAVASILAEQETEFATRLDGHRREIAIISRQVAALDEEIKGVREQKAATERQLAVVGEELARRRDLLERGLANRSEYTQFLLSQAQLTGQVGSLSADILSAGTQIAEKREGIARLESGRVETASAALNEVRAQVSDIEEQLTAAESVLARVAVRAPSDGLVVKLDFNARGAVVAPGAAMAEILPTSEALIVETRLPPQEVDAVRVGQAAELRLTALNRLTPAVEAQVTFVSPDRLVDPRTEQPYYLARLQLAGQLPPSVDPARLYPGMPVETFIETDARTFLDYLLKPIEDSFNRAFRER